MASWFHCNKCFLRINSSAAAKYVLSNCGHIYCDNCLPTGEPNTCCICRSECTTIALTANLTPDIQIFFANPEESLQKLVKVIEFQKDHGKKLIEHLEKENKILQNKYAHAKEFIKKLHKQHETLQKDHQRLRNILKLSIATSPVPGKNFRTPTGQGSVTSTPATATPTSGHPNRFMWNQSASHMLNKSVSSNQILVY